MLDLRGAVTIATALFSDRAWELVGATLDGRRRLSAHHHEKMDADVSFGRCFYELTRAFGSGYLVFSSNIYIVRRQNVGLLASRFSLRNKFVEYVRMDKLDLIINTIFPFCIFGWFLWGAASPT